MPVSSKKKKRIWGTIDHGHDIAGKANIVGLKLGEQSLVEALNTQMKFEDGGVSEVVGFDVQHQPMRTTHMVTLVVELKFKIMLMRIPIAWTTCRRILIAWDLVWVH